MPGLVAQDRQPSPGRAAICHPGAPAGREIPYLYPKAPKRTQMMRYLALLLLFSFLSPVWATPRRGYPAGFASAAFELPAAPLLPHDDLITLDPDWLADGGQLSAEFGYSVSAVGDVNADGYPDVIIGAPKYDNGVYREGAAFIYYGASQGLASNPGWIASSALSGARFGHSVAGIGDVNCDGVADIAVGAPRFNQDHPEEGAVYVFYGSPAGPSPSPDWMAQSNVKSAQLGSAVSGAGDVNDDGCADLLVGAPLYTNGQTSEGAVFLFLGSPSGLATSPAWMMESDQDYAMLGAALSPAGDVNGDGFADALVSAPQFESGEIEEGRVFAFYGSAAGLPSSPTWYADGNQDYARFGNAVASAEDLNADGYSDIVIGASYYDNPLGANDEGAIFVYYGSPGGLLSADRAVAFSGQANSGFGVSVASAGDLNCDGFVDVIVGAHLYSYDQPDEGAAFIFPGGESGLAAQPRWLVQGNKNDTWFGFSVASAADVNRDGFADIVVGAPLYKRDEKTIMGRAVVFHGLEGEEIHSYPVFMPLIIY